MSRASIRGTAGLAAGPAVLRAVGRIGDAGPSSHARDRATRSWRVASTPRLVAALAAACLLALAGCSTTPGGVPVVASAQAQGQDSRVLFLVLHYTQADMAGSMQILTRGPVSAHYLVSDETPPRIHRLVDEDRRAWHAGVSAWQGHRMLNAASIGIEIVHPGVIRHPEGRVEWPPFRDDQIELTIRLVQDIVARHGIRPDRVVAHSDVAPQRKVDPGPAFPWSKLAGRGLVRWPDPARVAQHLPDYEQRLPDVAWFQASLARLGYEVDLHGQLDEPTRRVIAAFQMKYRPSRHDGQPDAETAALLDVLLEPEAPR